MKQNDVYKILNRIWAVYKGLFASSQKEFDNLFEVWSSVLSDCDSTKVLKAVDDYIGADFEFPPKPGTILGLVNRAEKLEKQRKQAEEKYELSESTKRLLADLGKDETALDTEFDLLCREAYLRGLQKRQNKE
jgi:hypothetical protein